MVNQVAVMASLATLLSLLISVSVLAWKGSAWKREMELAHEELRADHREVMEAHALMHEDINKIVKEINGREYSNKEHCDVCEEIERSD